MRHIVGVMLAVLALAGCGNSAPVVVLTPATPTPVVTTHTVLYEAEGPGASRTASYTLRSDDGGTRQGEFDLPLRNQSGGLGLTFTGFAAGAFVYLSIQNGDEYGSVTCRITIDGVKLSENTSDGGSAIATCEGQVP